MFIHGRSFSVKLVLLLEECGLDGVKDFHLHGTEFKAKLICQNFVVIESSNRLYVSG